MALRFETLKARDQYAANQRDKIEAGLSRGVVCTAKHAGVCPRCDRAITKGDFLVKKSGKFGCCT